MAKALTIRLVECRPFLGEFISAPTSNAHAEDKQQDERPYGGGDHLNNAAGAVETW